MPVIVTATDFSDIASNAVHYTCGLANATGASVVVINSFIIPVTFNEMPMPVLPFDEGKKIAEENMQKLVVELKAAYPAINITGKVLFGDITDSLEEYAEEQKPWLVVVGNRSDEDTSFWLGSNMLSTLKNLPCPVLAVPPEAHYGAINNICFACDYKDVSEKMPVEDLMNVVVTTGAQLHILNVDHSKEFGVAAPPEASVLHTLLEKANPQYHFIDNEDTDAGIHDFVAQKSMDWLVVMPHKHSFFAGLFHKSHTKAMAKMSHIPLLALHEKG